MQWDDSAASKCGKIEQLQNKIQVCDVLLNQCYEKQMKGSDSRGKEKLERGAGGKDKQSSFSAETRLKSRLCL